ncbi:hypothetical protein VPH35_129251 [Triticum aestivum]|uniref:Uncharacterized protein n=1 Tax=Triticum turgidum subsp. durum TaxID=4567 RepID=A0A9R1BZR5_TRITD|nr:unnamed protein product [Triticum turgidum subsp. durum]
MMTMSTSSTRCHKDRDGELARRTPAIHFVMLELEDEGVAPVGDAANIYFVKLEPGRVELAGIPPCAMEEGETELGRTTPDFFFIESVSWRTETELARTTPVVFFIKPATWRTKAWRLATRLPPCHVG